MELSTASETYRCRLLLHEIGWHREEINDNGAELIKSVIIEWVSINRNWDFMHACILMAVFYFVGVGVFLVHSTEYSLKSHGATPRVASFHFSDPEEWMDAFYYVTDIMTTVAFGDFTPASTCTKLFLIFMTLVSKGFFFFIIQKGWQSLASHLECFFQRWSYLRKKFWKWLGPVLGILSSIIMGNMVFYIVEEDAYFLDSLYFSVTAIMTIGLGDLTFKNYIGKIFAVPWLVVSINVVQELFRNISHKKALTIYDKKVLLHLLKGYIQRDRARENA